MYAAVNRGGLGSNPNAGAIKKQIIVERHSIMRYLETVSREDKYYIGQVLERYGKKVKVVKIEPERKKGKSTGYYLVYVEDA